MGYSTSFEGVLKFSTSITRMELDFINKLINDEQCFDVEITEDFSGLRWDGSEKTENMVKNINVLIGYVTEKYPDFSLTGELRAEGEESDDRWILRMEDNKAVKIYIENTPDPIFCPHCGQDFFIN